MGVFNADTTSSRPSASMSSGGEVSYSLQCSAHVTQQHFFSNSLPTLGEGDTRRSGGKHRSRPMQIQAACSTKWLPAGAS